ncbi:MAG TPA: hypothetical protein VGR46_00365 [Candidatus Limnocylindria bacterium]|jgi:hypothetical protein|nr:hypothetical protein [Candidatus Limnocylindria bacterium]
MSVAAVAAPGGRAVLQRVALFGIAVVIGVVVAMTWNGSAAGAIYDGFLQLFLDPTAQIAGAAVGITLAFLLGAIHFVHI